MTLVPTDEVQTSFRPPHAAIQTAVNRSSDADLRNRDLVLKINDLRRIDNTSSWRYLAVEYLYMGCVLEAALCCWHAWFAGQLGDVALGMVVAATVVLGRIGQHRLVMLGHEASHYALFGKHWLNDLVSDLRFFPIWITTFNYRLQHRVHHQYTNDPVRDPDMAYMSPFARLAYIVLLTSSMVGLQITTGRPRILFYLVFWVLPLATTYSFLMVLREDIQHSNTGVGRFQNTRDAQVPLLARWAVFPFGMQLHLAHHLYSMVPHYRLPELDNLLQQRRRYREERVVIGVSRMTSTENSVAFVGAAP
jgi:fatty acid desaturase